MKYLIFEFDECYPIGGMHDLVKTEETLEEAINYACKLTRGNVEVYDRETLDMVWDRSNIPSNLTNN